MRFNKGFAEGRVTFNELETTQGNKYIVIIPKVTVKYAFLNTKIYFDKVNY